MLTFILRKFPVSRLTTNEMILGLSLAWVVLEPSSIIIVISYSGICVSMLACVCVCLPVCACAFVHAGVYAYVGMDISENIYLNGHQNFLKYSLLCLFWFVIQLPDFFSYLHYRILLCMCIDVRVYSTF